MDIKLPDIDGIEVTKIIRTFNNSVKILAQSAHIFPDERNVCLDAGCDGFISKPFNPQLLLEQMDTLLNA